MYQNRSNALYVSGRVHWNVSITKKRHRMLHVQDCSYYIFLSPYFLFLLMQNFKFYRYYHVQYIRWNEALFDHLSVQIIFNRYSFREAECRHIYHLCFKYHLVYQPVDLSLFIYLHTCVKSCSSVMQSTAIFVLIQLFDSTLHIESGCWDIFLSLCAMFF